MTKQSAITYDPETKVLTCSGAWDVNTFPQLKAFYDQMTWPQKGEITLNGAGLQKLDSAGALLINTWQQELAKRGVILNLERFSEKYQELLQIVKKTIDKEEALPKIETPGYLTQLGRITYLQFSEFLTFLSFVGLLTIELLRILRQHQHLRFNAYLNIIYRNGYLALPIIALLSFMIGVVMAYQMGLQLKNYGANVYIVDLLGLSILREFGPLLTAIMVAGRTGSSYTAQLGMMKINQEIDALNTMGVTPSELLLIPRIVGLVIVLPLLTIWSDIFGILGGMIMSNNMLNITWMDFLHRFPHVVKLKSLLLGLGKTPIFALIIASIGCFQGIQVTGSADSVGRNTTRSVVLSIFFIIVADATFSVIFSKLKL